MTANQEKKRTRHYLGVDVGGTKIQATLAEETGTILQRERSPTPRTGGPEKVLAAIERLIDKVVEQEGLRAEHLTAVGIAVPGVVDPEAGRVVVTPNMSLTGVELVSHLEGRFRVPVVLGNDCNLGALGEAWLGSARSADSVMAILVGTGIGGGFVRNGKLWRGARESAGEIGHIVMQIGGPQCGCGNRGCLEALASRSAIERDLREAVAAGRKTVLSDLLQGNFEVIRSSALRQALDAEDVLVSKVMRQAAEVLGYACLTVRHLLDPAVIVLGGGVIGACSDFIMPIVENIVGSDQLPGARDGGHVLLSALGDDAVVLGAVALARGYVGRSPFKKEFVVRPTYRELDWRTGKLTVGRKTYRRDLYITVDGEVKKRKKKLGRQDDGNCPAIGPDELAKVCKGAPEVLFVGAGASAELDLNEESHRYLKQRSIELKTLPTPNAVEAYNRSKQRKAALIRVTC